MKQQDLLKLEKQIGELSKEELFKRDLYLANLAKGKYCGPDVGYPHIDKKFLKYYTRKQIKSQYNEEACAKSLYEFLVEHCQDCLDVIAIQYGEIKITYREMLKKIDEYERSLIKLGLSEGETIAISAPTTPETICLLYAANKRGIAINLIDLRKDNNYIKHCLNRSSNRLKKAKALFVLDSQAGRIGKIIPETSVENVISLSPVESYPNTIKFLYKLKTGIESPKSLINFHKHMNFNEFTDLGKEYFEVKPVKYDKDRVAILEYTSGSTALPKAVELNDATANNRVYQYMNNGMEHEIGDGYLDIIPIFVAFGVIIGVHLPLCMGMRTIPIAAFNAHEIYAYFEKYIFQHTTLTPYPYNELIHDERFSKLCESDDKTLGCGGDGMTAFNEEATRNAFAKQGCTNPIINGGGSSEVGAPFCTQRNDIAVYGSVGIPLPGNNVIVFKHGTNERVGYNTIGDLGMIVDNPMLGYSDDEERTNKAMIKLPDGRIAVCLGDAGYVDSDGQVFMKGRWSDAIYKDGKCLWPIDIESAAQYYDARNYNSIKICAVVPIEDEYYDCRLFFEKSNDFDDDMIMSLEDELYRLYGLNVDVICVNELLRTGSDKIARTKLKTIGRYYE